MSPSVPVSGLTCGRLAETEKDEKPKPGGTNVSRLLWVESAKKKHSSSTSNVVLLLEHDHSPFHRPDQSRVRVPGNELPFRPQRELLQARRRHGCHLLVGMIAVRAMDVCLHRRRSAVLQTSEDKSRGFQHTR